MTTEDVDRSWQHLCADIHRQSTRTPRVDTLRNRLTATRQLLAMVEDELEDLHVLAYERQTLTHERVHGGQPDYALDTHGDMRARDAYRDLGFATIHALEVLAEVAHTIRSFMMSGERGANPRRMIAAEELAGAIEAQARRAARGEYTPKRREAQPDSALAEQTLDNVIRERDRYKTRTERLEKQLERVAGPGTTRRRQRRSA